MKKHLLIFSAGLLMTVTAFCQEFLIPLVSNPALKNSGKLLLPQTKTSQALQLPFLDDFSNNSVYPDTAKWIDRFAFVNRSFGPMPPSLGMATLDLLDDTGAVYPFATSTPFIADFLTSKPIRLDSIITGTPQKLTPADSIYFSFFYQPQGYGNSPEPEDSLILEFRKPNGTWKRIWSAPGMTYTNFFNLYNRSFRLIMIPVLDTVYFKPDFQFRFKNYGSIINGSYPSWQSNMDQWNIDYVYLNKGRSKNDTTFNDIVFVERAPSMLKDYAQMPGRQFNNSELKSAFSLKIKNLASNLNNISYQYKVEEAGGTFSYTKLGGVYDIYPYITHGEYTYPLHTNPAVDFTLPAITNDSTVFYVTHSLGINGWADNIPRNDTIRYRQEFYNYYAYDDGTAELGYGLSGVGARLAYQFTLNNPDTIGGVKMFFNQTLQPPISREFYIVIWTSLNPEIVLYRSKRYRPVVGDSLNKFHTYYFIDTNILVSGTFYIGWQQITEDVLNVGFDRSTNSQSRIYYNTSGTWQNTVYSGSLMIRPVLGTAGHAGYGISEKSSGINPVIFPNPVKDILNIHIAENIAETDAEKEFCVEIFNRIGQKLMETNYKPRLPVNHLPDGYYILRIRSLVSGESYKIPFIKTR